MICHNCGAENPEGRRYCEECNEKLAAAEHERRVSSRRTQREAARIRREAETRGLDAEVLERRRRGAARKAKPWMGLALLGAVVLAVVLAVALTSSSSASAPERVVQDFFGSIKNRDVMGFLKNTTEAGTYEQVKKGEMPPPEPSAYIPYDRYDLRDIRTELVSEGAEQAEVRITGGWFQGFWKDDAAPPSTGVDFAQYPRRAFLERHGGAWVITNYTEIMLPMPMPESMGGEDEGYPETEEGL